VLGGAPCTAEELADAVGADCGGGAVADSAPDAAALAALALPAGIAALSRFAVHATPEHLDGIFDCRCDFAEVAVGVAAVARYAAVGRLNYLAAAVSGREIIQMIPKTSYVPYIHSCLETSRVKIDIFRKGKYHRPPPEFGPGHGYWKYLDAVVVAALGERAIDGVVGGIVYVPGGREGGREDSGTRTTHEWRTPQKGRTRQARSGSRFTPPL
jgi:hypothetical protein